MPNHGLPESLRTELDSAHKAREGALARCREIIQMSSKSIRAAHRNELDASADWLRQAQERATQLRTQLATTPTILYAGYLQDAEKEMVEAAVLLAVVQGNTPPTAEELKVEATTYLHGIAEAASEARRTILDALRHGNAARAEGLLEFMEEVYADLITFDFPDGLTGGLRRTTDALRAVLERTRSDVTLTAMQNRLIEELKRHESRLH